MNRTHYIYIIALLFLLGAAAPLHAQTIKGNIYGGGELATVDGNTRVQINNGTIGDGSAFDGDVFGGGLGATAIVTGNPVVNISGGTIGNNVFGGGSLAETVGDPTVNVSGGTVAKDVYGGGALADVTGNTSVILTGGSVGDAYGGGLGSAEVAAKVVNSSVLVKEDANVNNVFGCNNTNGTPTGTVNVEIAGGTVNENAFGGGHLANATANPVVTVSGGTVTHDVYGGGALADVTGNTTVNLTGGAVGGAYGGALGSAEVAAKVNGDTYVHLDGSKVTETGVFGANNLNGTPTGHVKVHVTSTTPRDGQGTEEYDVPAVYGGGNLSAYEPSDAKDFAEVLIENCDNSIEYVYGGGNAAPVPATSVTIFGANAINHAFAGGNGAGANNPGADVGYLGYYSNGHATEYGTGKASITVYGGTVNNVYGGSNTLGYIRGGTSVSVENGVGDCPLVVGNVFGGGNEADIDCSVTMNLDCNEGGAVLYAGANNANVNGDITLNIHSGTYGKVFCGNNTGGKIFGNLKVNVDETGCWPVMIGELYGCGNMAPYSVYGYNDDGTCKTSGDRVYDDPVVNLISFTRIGKVFGGGYGEKAVLYGNTHVNVEPIKGIFAGRNDVQPGYILDANDNRVFNTEAIAIPDESGSIGSIYGGGNAGAVYGNTEVKIGTLTQNHHISGSEELQAETQEVAVTITGNVFGGGNEAIVSGNTIVTIGE
ncbi:MAG: hypothetical protein Q4D23_04470 [Bacteroidales bacterium]|nr:hypothetical protein [Bacteroidales bacterium]